MVPWSLLMHYSVVVDAQWVIYMIVCTDFLALYVSVLGPWHLIPAQSFLREVLVLRTSDAAQCPVCPFGIFQLRIYANLVIYPNRQTPLTSTVLSLRQCFTFGIKWNACIVTCLRRFYDKIWFVIISWMWLPLRAHGLICTLHVAYCFSRHSYIDIP
jgi:hypothetical protein